MLPRELPKQREAKSTNMQLVADLADHNSSGVHCWREHQAFNWRKGAVVEGCIRLLAMGGGLGQREVWIRSGEAVSER